MRLKENSDNWRASAIIKRDFKHDHADLKNTYKSHKNRRKWCRGKVGINHTIKWRKEVWLFSININVGQCTSCGKHMYR